MKTLVLFDVDGTLITVPLSHEEGFIEAMKKAYDVDVTLEEVRLYEGDTDKFCIFDVLKKRGFSEEKINEKLDEARDVLTEFFTKNFKNEDVKVMPGIFELLNTLKDKTNVALITGNIEKIAWLKMKRFKLDTFFKLGGFGGDHLERKDVVKAAIKKSESYFKKKFEKIVVIGDTPHDIEAAKSHNAMAIGVATGEVFDIKDLKKANADYFFENFKDYKKVAEVILK